MNQHVAVLGAGSWGTALAIVLADNGIPVKIWTRRREQAEEINQQHRNERYLPNTDLPQQIYAHDSIEEVVKEAGNILSVVPTKAVRETMKLIKPHLHHHPLLIHATKGIEPGTSKRISEMMEEELDDEDVRAIAVLSGPSHAEEVSKRQPTTVTVSSKDEQAALDAQDLFMNANFRVYTNPDMIGVELGGALKNIIAICIGLTNGLGYGDNAKAALMTRGLAEITRLGIELGARPLTFAGLSGLGDLIVTCTSSHSRNWRAGKMLGEGYNLDQVLKNMGMVVEGIRTTKAVYEMAERLDVEMPITNALYKVLFSDEHPKQAALDLMGRVKKHEVEDLALHYGTDENNQG